jgi:energy-coupling factor transport system substrate-specific component
MNLLISSLIVASLLIIALVRFEKTKPKPRDLMPVIVLSVLAVLGRVLLTPVPNFQPATALIILTGLFFGRYAGLLSGALVALASNMLMGQGLWTPWQMLAWGLVGYGAGLIGDIFDKRQTRTSQVIILIYGVLASLAFGMIMDFQFFLMGGWETGWQGLLLIWSMGMPLNLMHAASTLIFLFLTLVPWGKKLGRLKTKYGITKL